MMSGLASLAALAVRPREMCRRLLAVSREAEEANRYMRIFRKYADFTMIPATTYVTNLFLAQQCRQVPGCVVECGVWRGGMIAGIAELLGSERDYVLFDSFAGLPPAKDIDGAAAIAWQADTKSPGYFDNCTAPRELAERAMRLAGAARVTIREGWFTDTLRGFTPPGPIALLRLDGDWYDSTMTCLEALFPHLSPQGIVIVDDYSAWDGCRKAVHDYLSREQSAAAILRARDDVTFIRFPPSAEVPTPEAV